ncbi:MAG: MotA/TolQ/ExbB proton channel family protein [Gammaproteobacteria bacterium]
MENTEATAVVENPYGLGALWEQGDFVAKGTLIIMVIMSLTSWYVIIMKLLDQRKLSASAKVAEQKFWSAGSIREAIERLPKNDVYRQIAEDGLRASQHHEGRLGERIALHEWVTMSLQRSNQGVSMALTGGLPWLATVGSTAPFVGLFGTVWGIYHALVAIGVSGQASIDKVAGPVGEALIMTAIGLAVAVPAVMGYNWLIRRNKEVQEELGNFTSDLHSFLVSGARVAVPAPAAAPAAAKK